MTFPLAGWGNAKNVAESASTAQISEGRYIRWQEHIIDDPQIAGFALSGSDGLVMTDLDLDGHLDIVSVHESDDSYDSATHVEGFTAPVEGHVRIAFGSADPHQWHNITVAEGADAAAPEDAAVGDINNDGYPDIMVAAELSHLLYLQNPGRNARTEPWPRLILPLTRQRGSYLRVFMADFDRDGQLEVSAANKGAQIPGPEDYKQLHPVSVFKVNGDPLVGENWQELELGRYSVPQNAEPVDLDGDGDMDIVAGSRGEGRLVFFENTGAQPLAFKAHPIVINGSAMGGFNLAYADLNGDQRLDIIGATAEGLAWIAQPEHMSQAWQAYIIGTFAPDSMTGIASADIDGDGDIDIMAGSYSRGDRQHDDAAHVNDQLGRIGWFENPGDATTTWRRHDISRRVRGMYDKFVAWDADGDGDVDFAGTRGNSAPFDGVFWLEQIRSPRATPVFTPARKIDSREMPLP